MVPEGWERHPVGDLFEVQLGKMLNKEAKKKEPQFPYLTNINVRWGSFDTSELNTMHFSDRDREKFSLMAGDLIMCEGGEVGRCAIWVGEVTPCYYQKALHRLRTKGRITPEYFQAYMESIAGTKLLENYTSRTSIAHLTREKLVELPVKVPPLGEQKKIAKILSTWDKAIATVEKLIANSQQQKKALMQQLLTGKKRLPGFGGDWELIALGDIGAISSAGVDKKVVKGESEVRLLNFLDVFRREFIYNRELNHSVTAPAAKIEKCSVQKGDIFFTPSSETREDLAMAAVAAEDMGGVVYSYHVVRFRPGIDLDLKFSAYLFQTDDFRRQAYKAGDGSGQRYVISQSSFRTMRVRVPNIDEQQAIGEILYDLSKEESVQVANLKLLKEEKKALMQQLLTGKRRVLV